MSNFFDENSHISSHACIEVAFQPISNSKMVATAGWDGTIKLWETLW
jgi:hypothetical protein